MTDRSASARPHYITLDDCQIRVWRRGEGPDLVVLPGLALGASVVAARLGNALAGWTVSVLELPGLGGSISAASETLDATAERLAAACRQLGLEIYALAAFDLAAPLADRLARKLARRPIADVRIGLDRACAWRTRRFLPPDLTAHPDGTHLTALWAHIRDCHVLDAVHPGLPAFEGEALPTAHELHASFTAAALLPANFARLWSLCLDEVSESDAAGVLQIVQLDGLAAHLGSFAAQATKASSLPATQALSGGRIWNDYVELSAGLLHVRRAGTQGRPLLLFPSGGGSAEIFAPVIQRLARTHQVVAVDYFGNGESDKPERAVSIETLAEDAKELADRLGFDSVDLWGSHTGALIAMELAVRHPSRVGRVVLEGPVFISSAFQADLLEKYFPPMALDQWGLHLQLFWNWRRDLFMYWPWYRVDYAAARRLGIPEPTDIHRFVMGLLQSGPHYSRAYRSAYIYRTSDRIGLLRCPTLVCAGPNDMLVDGLPQAKRLAPKTVSVMLTPTTAWWPAQRPNEIEATLDIYERFLAGASQDESKGRAGPL
jgi:pimeloyl-ACP methyl ester carboxylesterase